MSNGLKERAVRFLACLVVPLWKELKPLIFQ